MTIPGVDSASIRVFLEDPNGVTIRRGGLAAPAAVRGPEGC
jgi:hypothetical protein